jgi:hypothetical protein
MALRSSPTAPASLDFQIRLPNISNDTEASGTCDIGCGRLLEERFTTIRIFPSRSHDGDEIAALGDHLVMVVGHGPAPVSVSFTVG